MPFYKIMNVKILQQRLGESNKERIPMDAIEIKKLLDQHGARLINKFMHDQQALADTFKAELARTMSGLLPELIKRLPAKKPKEKKDETKK